MMIKFFWTSCLIILTFSLNDVSAQDLNFSEAQVVFGEQRILKFRKFSLEMTDKSAQDLKELTDLIKLTPSLIKRNLLIIQVFTCEKELNIKPYLGVCRGQLIIDYLEKSIGMPRKKCLIQDGGANSYDKECLAGSGANLYIKPDWRGRQ